MNEDQTRVISMVPTGMGIVVIGQEKIVHSSIFTLLSGLKKSRLRKKYFINRNRDDIRKGSEHFSSK